MAFQREMRAIGVEGHDAPIRRQERVLHTCALIPVPITRRIDRAQVDIPGSFPAAGERRLLKVGVMWRSGTLRLRDQHASRVQLPERGSDTLSGTDYLLDATGPRRERAAAELVDRAV